MKCNYCEKGHSQHSTHYNIANVRERFIPTYAHEQIFLQTGGGSANIRCTPTFHSTAFDVRGYQPNVNQHLRTASQKKEGTVVYRNDSKLKREVALNPNQNI